MLMNDMGDDSQEQQQIRIWRSAAMLAGLLSIMVTVSAALAAVLPGLPMVTRVMSGVAAVVSAVGVWQAGRSHRRRSVKHFALALTCALGSIAAMAASRSTA